MKLEVKNTQRYGRGVFAIKKIKQGSLVLTNHVVVLDKADSNLIERSELRHYVFNWGHGCSALALGIGSLINHSKKHANIEAFIVKENQEINFYTTKDIKAGEQLFLNYGYEL